MGKKRNKLDRFYYLEALDRAFMVGNIVDEYLTEHPVIQKHKKLKKRVKMATKLLAEAYQIIGGLDIQLFPDNTEMRGKQ
jgi:hypothetical protein